MEHTVSIEHVQVNTPSARNQRALQLALQQTLDQMLVPAEQLPSGAILLIRNYAPTAPFPSQSTARRRWVTGVSEQIGVRVKQAHRPAAQPVTEAANCVLFMDSAEMVYCYTRDMLAGQNRWYWRTLFGTQAAAHTRDRIISAWLNYPEAIPTLVTRLPGHDVRRILVHVTPSQTADLILALHRHFDIPDTILEFDIPSVSPPTRNDLQGQIPLPPWQRALSVTQTASFSPQMSYLWGLATTLAQQPHIARSTTFAQAATHWLKSALTQQHDPELYPVDSAGAPTADDWPSPRTDATTRNDEIDHSAAHEVEGFVTQLGGVFYLINLVDWLLSISHAEAIQATNRWEIVAALAQTMLADDLPRYRDDPLWQHLHDIALLPDDAAWGDGLTEIPYFALRPEALAEWGVQHLRYVFQETHGRVRLIAPELKLILLDTKIQSFNLAAIIQAYAEAGIEIHQAIDENGFEVHAPSLASAHPAVQHWLACVLPLCDFRVRFTTPQARTTWADILAVPATVQRTFTHIDVRLNMNSINRDIRRSGLDQNPGWLCDYGYIINFYFHE